MKIMRVFHNGAIFSLNMYTITAAAAVSQPVNSLAIGPVANLTALSLPANLVNLSAVVHYFVPESTMRIDFEHFTPQLALEDTQMCLVLSLAAVDGHADNEPLSDFSFHYGSIVLNIEDSGHPSPGKEYTYGALVTTLTGIGLYMAEYDRYLMSRFRIYDISDVTKPIPLATGMIKGRVRGNNGSAISLEGLGDAVTATLPVGTS